MIDLDNYNKAKQIEEKINKEGLNKILEDLMKNPYKEKVDFNDCLNRASMKNKESIDIVFEHVYTKYKECVTLTNKNINSLPVIVVYKNKICYVDIIYYIEHIHNIGDIITTWNEDYLYSEFIIKDIKYYYTFAGNFIIYKVDKVNKYRWFKQFWYNIKKLFNRNKVNKDDFGFNENK